MTNERVTATYRIETPFPLEEATEAMAGEQSSGTFIDVPRETDELEQRHAARVESIDELGSVKEPTLPGVEPPADADEYVRAEVVLSFPVTNIGASLPNLKTMVAGNLFELRYFSGLRLLDVEIPKSISSAYPGPAYGITGTREILDVEDRPIIGTIIKPSVGLSPAETADLVEKMVAADLDFIKDDELIASPAYSSITDRVSAIMAIIDAYRERTGKKVLYACNITGDIDEMLERHDAIVEAGGNCVMVSLNSVGIAAVAKLRRHADVPIHGHRNGWGALSRCPQLGFSFTAYQKFYRLAGVDHLHVNGIRNKFCESDKSVIESANALQTPINELEDVALPVFSSGQWADQAPDTYRALGNVDCMHLAGGGIMGHPDGPAAGVEHLKQGWEAAMKGVALTEYAEDHKELRRGIEQFGPARSDG